MFTVRMSLSKYGQLPFQAVNLIFHLFYDPWSPQASWVDCVACNTILLKDKHLKTASRMVMLCQHECGNAIKSQLRIERSICTSFSGSCLITCTRLASLRTPGLTFCRLWAGKPTAEYLPPTQTSSLEHGGDGLPTAGWSGMKRKDYWAFSYPIHYISTIFKMFVWLWNDATVSLLTFTE